MTFLPNKIERYTAALRSYIQFSALRNGFNTKNCEKLKKIYNFEALFSEEIIPINIYYYLSDLLTAVFIIKNEKGLPFRFNIKFSINCLINVKTFTALILNICSKAEFVEISFLNGNLIIKTNIKLTKHSLKLSKKLKGCVFYEIKTNTLFIKLPVTSTDKKVMSFSENSIEDYVLNPFSIVNIFL